MTRALMVERLDACNVEDMNAAHPATFLIAPRALRESIPVGGFAKVAIGGPVADPERVWVEVAFALDPASGRYIGKLANEPLDPRHGVRFGALLSFGPEHVLDLVLDPVAEWGTR